MKFTVHTTDQSKRHICRQYCSGKGQWMDRGWKI